MSTSSVLTVSNAITVDFWDDDKNKKRGKMAPEGVLNGKRYKGE